MGRQYTAHGVRQPAVAIALWLSTWAFGCDGSFSPSSPLSSDSTPGGTSATGTGGLGVGTGGTDLIDSMPKDAVGRTDQQMQMLDPDLFEVARTYFPSERLTDAPTRLARLTHTQLDATVRALWPQVNAPLAAEALPADPLQTNYAYPENLSWNPANFEPMVHWSRGIAEAIAQTDPGPVPCVAQDSDCLRESAAQLVASAFRGITTPDQLTSYQDFFTQAVADRGLVEGTQDLLDLTLTSPAYLFRDEVTTDDVGQLLSTQRLQQLTYTLTDAPPTAVGLNPADAAATLRSEQAIAATVDQLLATDAARQKLVRFFRAWLEVKTPGDFDISSEVFPEFTQALSAAMVAETDTFLRHQLQSAAPKLTAITQSTQSFVSTALQDIYGQSGNGPDELADLDPDQRLGIFTQPAVIASHSGPTTTRLVKRGVFFTRKIMCLPLGAPPGDVDTTVPETPGLTERQRIEGATQGPRCQGCHAYINPFGFMQESYDPIGRFRTHDGDLPVDTRIDVQFLDEGPLQTTTAVQAIQNLTDSYRFQQCFVRQLFRYYVGRNEQPGDHPLLRQMFFSFAGTGQQDIVQLLRMLAGSPSFSRRSEAQ